MRATTFLAIVAIIAALAAVTLLIPIHQVNAAPFKNGPPINGFLHACSEAEGTHGPNNAPFCSLG